MMLIDGEKLKNLIRITDFYLVSKNKFLKEIKKCEVNIKSPAVDKDTREALEEAIDYFLFKRASVTANTQKYRKLERHIEKLRELLGGKTDERK